MNSGSIFTKNNLITLLFLAILILAIPLAVKLAQQTQIFKSKAGSTPIQFSGTGVDCAGTSCTTTNTNVNVILNSCFEDSSC
ncbi:MAG: hypothetical protein HYW45_03505 [Candidatus Daviesbacteria bacterium]|nr:MAG: hypothetical protein HYW45_03505 [Candidatus Daviesbacteria bacterium]